ncbi:MAG TPA: hypothetical protein VGR78_10295 [Verrucomicrobiae bacterium]|jgi:adenine-specific DNA methylase|nr:hypothetical protein [Verrucomicrobiae bacterium]
MSNRNKMKRRLAPGIWEDMDGALHISAPEILSYFGVENTEENRVEAVKMFEQIIREKYPDIDLRQRNGSCPKCGGMIRVSEEEERSKGEFCCFRCGHYCSEAELVENFRN